jgi:hypothetical protein
MGGGLFGTPLYLNTKCLVFSAFVLIVYWLPHPKEWTHRAVTAFLLACSAYVLMAWYDVIYDCNDRLKPTLLGWMWKWAKPSEYEKEYNKLPIKYKKIIRTVDIGILFIVVLAIVYPYLHTKKL